MPAYFVKDETDKPTWANKLEYHLSICSYVFGLITFWRFPYLAYENAGAPFLYIFLLLFLLIGIPIIFMEMTWGQYGNLSPLQAFKNVPAMQGIGICMLFLSCSCIVYFGSVSYYLLLYLASSFSYTQPWITCSNAWNSESCQIKTDCTSYENFPHEQNISSGVEKSEVYTSEMCNRTSEENVTTVTPAIEFWINNIAVQDNICLQYPNVSDVLIGLGSSNILLAPIISLSCFVAVKFIVSIFAVANHVRLTGKVAYILSLLSFVVVCILLVRCVSLDGSTHGLLSLVVPRDLESFFKPKVWKDACGQVFLSVLAVSGGLITWSSHNRFYNKYQYDASLLIVMVPLMSAVSAVTMFSVAGYLTYGTDIDPLNAFQEAKGPIAPFVAYSEALTQMWGGPLVWGVVVFLTFFLSSATAAFPYMECILSSLSDTIPSFRKLLLRNFASIFLILLTMGSYIGVPCFVQGTGLLIIDFFDSFPLPLSLMIVALVEILLLFYSFGPKLLYTNAKAMTSSPCMKSHFWTFVWGGLTPVVILACLVYTVFGIIRDGVESMVSYTSPEVGSLWSDIAGGIYVGFVFIVLLLVALTKVALSSGPCKAKFLNAFSPHGTRVSGRNGSGSSPSNGSLYLTGYSSHHPHRMEVLIDEDVITTV